MNSILSNSRSLTSLRFAFALAAMALLLTAASAAGGRALAQETSETLVALRSLQARGDNAGMLRLLERACAKTEPESFDAAFLLQMKGGVLLTMKRFPEALAAYERQLELSRKHGYFEAATEDRIEQTVRRLRETIARQKP